MAGIQPPDSFKDLPKAIITQMIMLSTGGFGVVVALAWNEFIKNVVEVYVKPYLGQGSGVWSLFIYAAAITVVAVLVTMQLTKIQRKFEIDKENEIDQKKQKSDKQRRGKKK
jgi:uncharacterized membrane protein (DUF106 family)